MLVFCVSFVILMFLGVPIGFTMLGSSLAYTIMTGLPLQVLILTTTKTISESFVLISVPFFIMAASVMNFGGITEKIFGFANRCVGWITGGLGHANIFASLIFAGMSGSAVADAGGLGAIEIAAMRKNGYDDDFSVAITGASSLLGPIVPPSNGAVLYSVVSGVSLGSLFLAGYLPALLIAGCQAGMVYFTCKKRKYPKIPRPSARELAVSFTDAVWELLTPVVLLGGLYSGLFTPTEAAVVAVLYALIVAMVKRNLLIKNIPQLLCMTADSVCNIMFIVASSGMMGYVLTRERLPAIFTEWVVSNFSEKWTVLLLINAVMFIVGCFMDGSPAIMILTPILLPIAVRFGIDPIHFGMIQRVNLGIGLLTPPVGMVLYVLSSVSGIPFERISKSILPYIGLELIILLLVTFIPGISMFLPNLFA